MSRYSETKEFFLTFYGYMMILPRQPRSIASATAFNRGVYSLSGALRKKVVGEEETWGGGSCEQL